MKACKSRRDCQICIHGKRLVKEVQNEEAQRDWNCRAPAKQDSSSTQFLTYFHGGPQHRGRGALVISDVLMHDPRMLGSEGEEALAPVVQRSCGCPIPGSVHGQGRWDLEQPGLKEGVPAYGRGVEQDGL